jgi:hypothetical protein
MGRMLLNCNHRSGAGGGQTAERCHKGSRQWTVAGKDDREPSGHLTREGIGLKHGEPDGRRTASQAVMQRGIYERPRPT